MVFNLALYYEVLFLCVKLNIGLQRQFYIFCITCSKKVCVSFKFLCSDFFKDIALKKVSIGKYMMLIVKWPVCKSFERFVHPIVC